MSLEKYALLLKIKQLSSVSTHNHSQIFLPIFMTSYEIPWKTWVTFKTLHVHLPCICFFILTPLVKGWLINFDMLVC